MTIILTGGHAGTTGYAVIEELKARNNDLTINWLGDKNEHKIYSQLDVKFYSIIAGKLQTKLSRFTILHILKIPIGFIHSFILLLKLKPRVIMSFGGFTAFPVVFCGWLLRIPIILHEQTVLAGRANLASRFFAKKILLGHVESQKFFPKDKSIVVGNPIRKSILSVRRFTTRNSPPTILVMGGSRGSEFINNEIIKIAQELKKKYKVIHISGVREHNKVKVIESGDYQVLSFIDPDQMGEIYQKTDLIIARSGANTVSEIEFIRRPAILIPLPRTFMGEQVENAKYLEKLGIAKVLLETEVNKKTLLSTISYMLNKKVPKVISPNINASKKVVDVILEYIK